VAIAEARRVLKPAGRLLLLSQADERDTAQFERQMAVWCGAAGLRLASPRRIPAKNPRWVLAVASPVGHESVAA
jgi:ubiquinone/menaquinone biosynthesis C-methylase UbiE